MFLEKGGLSCGMHENGMTFTVSGNENRFKFERRFSECEGLCGER